MQSRREATEKYEAAKREGLVDEDIVHLLDKINSSKHYYTTSSCSGRIGIMEIPEIGDKKNAVFLGKWHRIVRVEEVREAIEKYSRGYLFMLVQSPIIHIVTSSVDEADRLITLAKNCGFKYTSIKRVSREGVLVEVLSTENLQIPLGEAGTLKIHMGDIDFFTKMANKLLSRAKEKLAKFEKEINCLLPSSS